MPHLQKSVEELRCCLYTIICSLAVKYFLIKTPSGKVTNPKWGAICERLERGAWRLAAEAVEGAALALERVDDIHGGDGLPASVLGVGHGVADDVLEEHLEDRAGLLVDEAGDTLHATTASETADSGLGDALDVVAPNLPVALGATLAETLCTLTASGHSCVS